ncbi:MAG TPA: hypothetical protein VHR86_05845 [Armatimonadota bacterium]|nr:hypothetical protein [Armatimonadota bacterium]
MSERKSGGGESVPSAPTNTAFTDERRVMVRRRPAGAVLAGGFPWLVLLAWVWLMELMDVHWQFANGRINIGLQLAALLFGLAYGLRRGIRNIPWVSWPPQGTLLHWRARVSLDDLAHGWWQFAGLQSFITVLSGFVAVLVMLGLRQPQAVAGVVYGADLLWSVFLAMLLGDIAGMAQFQPRDTAITARGIHTAPISFVRWDELSHALVEPEERVIRIYTRRRSWLPRNVLTFPSTEQTNAAAALIAPNLPCLTRAQLSRADRWRWNAFAAGLLLVHTALSLLLLALLLLPDSFLLLIESLRIPVLNVATALVQLPEVIFFMALLSGLLLDSFVERLRGITMKKIVSE